MEITRVSPQTFDAHFPGAPCFNQAAFNALNTDLCDTLHCLLFGDSKIRLGLIAGQRGKNLLTPFSAPFGGFVTTDSKIQIAYIEEAIGLLETYANQQGIHRIEMILPPLFYDTAFLTKLTQVLHRKSWLLQDIDLDFYVDLQNTSEANHFGMSYSAQKNLKTALKHPFNLIKSQSMENLAMAFDIIAANRSAKGYALSLTKERLLATATVVNMESFILELEGQYVASTIVYQVTPVIPLVVYWGDLPGYESFRTMNYLTQGVIDSYRKEGYWFLDTGTAMLGSKPNPGLCAFKESIGCTILPRCQFIKQLT